MHIVTDSIWEAASHCMHSKIHWIGGGDGKNTIQRCKKGKEIKKTLSPQEKDAYNNNL